MSIIKRHSLKLALALAIGAGLTALIAMTLLAPDTHAMGRSGKAAVRRAEVLYTPGTHSLYVRVSLSDGMTVKYNTDDAKDVENLLALFNIYAQQNANLYAVLEEDNVKSFMIDIH